MSEPDTPAGERELLERLYAAIATDDLTQTTALLADARLAEIDPQQRRQLEQAVEQLERDHGWVGKSSQR